MAWVNNVLVHEEWLNEINHLVNDTCFRYVWMGHSKADIGESVATDKFVIIFPRIIEEREYLIQQVYNCDMTG